MKRPCLRHLAILLALFAPLANLANIVPLLNGVTSSSVTPEDDAGIVNLTWRYISGATITNHANVVSRACSARNRPSALQRRQATPGTALTTADQPPTRWQPMRAW